MKKKSILSGNHRENLPNTTSYRKTLLSTIYVSLIVFAIAVLIANFLLSAIKIRSSSMNPTLESNNIVLTIKQERFNREDIVAFTYDNKILIRRIVGVFGDWIKIDEEKNVFVNDAIIAKLYPEEKFLSECDVGVSYQIPENTYFVLSDSRDTFEVSQGQTASIISKDKIIGRIFLNIWPLDSIKII